MFSVALAAVTAFPGLQVGALVLGLAIAIIFHEVAHGYAALRLGDPTAYYAGRLSLNPAKHIDLWGTILIPGFLILSGTGFVFGWAKPVPVNYYNLRKGKYGPLLVALAGPATNLLILVVFSVLARYAQLFFAETALPFLFGMVAFVSGLLMMFNLLPIPPLDGSKVLYVFLERRPDIIQVLERYGMMILIFVLIFGRGLLSFIMIPVFYLIATIAGTDVLLQLLAGF